MLIAKDRYLLPPSIEGRWTAIKMPANAVTLYIYSTNENRLVKTDCFVFCLIKAKKLKELVNSSKFKKKIF